MKTGVYRIANVVDGKVYFGSSHNIKKRLAHHKCLLLTGEHDNKHLQASFTKYGLTNFKFEVVLYCSKADCLFYEQRILKWAARENSQKNTGRSCLPPPRTGVRNDIRLGR